jgi:DNA-binding CsgD family transcriptional regulator/PAS domain-containing protein
VVVWANDVALRMVGLSRAQLLGEEPPAQGWQAREEAGSGELNAPLPLAGLGRDCPRTFLLRVTLPGELRPTWIRGDLVAADGHDPPCGAVSTLTDVSAEHVRAETALALAARRLARLQGLRNAAMAMNASHDLRLTLHVIVQQATVHLGVSAAAVALLDEDSDVLVYAAGAGFRRSGITSTRLTLGQGYLGRAALERRPFSIPDLSSTSDFLRHDLLDGEDFVAYFALPLVSRNRLVGVLELLNRGPLDLEPEWLEFVETLADHAASAIESTRLRERLRLAGPSPRQKHGMTQRQEAILRLLALGQSNRDIARRVFLSENTIKFHLRQIYRALGVRTRAEAVVAAADRGWL